MKIVFVSKECPPSPRSSGIGTYVWETGRSLAAIGHTVTIVAAADDGLSSTFSPAPNFTVIRLPDDEIDVGKRNIVTRTLFGPIRQGIAYRGRVARCLHKLAEQDKVEIVEFCGFRGESYVWLDGASRLPMVVRMHGFTAGLDTNWKKQVSASGRCLNKWELREVLAADLITAVSEDQAATVRGKFGSDRVTVVYNSIDTTRWDQPSAGAAANDLCANDILYAGGLAAKKGIFVLLKAAERLRKHGWSGRLVLAGRVYRDFDRFLKRRAVLRQHFPPWITLLGTCSRERLAGLYRNAGICCFPSLQDPFPYTCMEAMTCGSVVVGSAHTGMAEMLTQETGFLAQPGDVDSLTAAIRAAFALTENDRIRMKEAARRRSRDCFDHQVILPRLISIYERVLDAFNKGRRVRQCNLR